MRRYTIAQFIRAQFSSLSATGVDYVVTVLLFQFFQVGYVWSTAIGAICGGLFNAVVNYRWTFRGTSRTKRAIAVRYLFVWLGSIIFNTFGVSLLAPLLSSSVGLGSLMFAKVIVNILVGLLWNFVLQKYWVYRH